MAPTPWGLRSGGGRPWRDTEPTAAASRVTAFLCLLPTALPEGAPVSCGGA